ncbi:MAG TPA: hypothetical protein VF310_00555 [Vicinamibacteria bacterium]
MSKRKLSDALASRSPLIRRDAVEPMTAHERPPAADADSSPAGLETSGRAEQLGAPPLGETTIAHASPSARPLEERNTRHSQPDASKAVEYTAVHRDRGDHGKGWQSLGAQPTAAEEGAGTSTGTPGIPEALRVQAQLGQASLEFWIDAQRQLWDGWFALVGAAMPASSVSLPAFWGRQLLQAWQETGRQVLDAQTQSLRRWSAWQPGQLPDRYDRSGG